jgi:hypothetical protein
MQKKGFNFFEDLEIRLKLDGKEQYGNLKIRKNRPPVLALENFLLLRNDGTELIDNNNKEIKCKSDIHEYTLSNCKTNDHFIYPRYVIEGSNDEAIYGLEISLTGFSSWFDQQTHFQINKDEIKKDIPKIKFEEKVSIDGSDYWISSNYCCNVVNVEKRDFLVSEYTTIMILKVSGYLTILEAEEKAHDIRRLFSLLLGQPLSIEYTWLLVGDKHYRSPFYFSCSGTPEEPFKYVYECLVYPGRIVERGLWKDILHNYFSSPARKKFTKIWSRLPSLFSYSGPWEYELLGYVSILDAYCDLYVEKSRRKLNPSDYQSIKGELLEVVEKHKNKLGNDFHGIMESFKNGIEGIKNTDLPTFKEKFLFMLSDIDKNVKDMIAFSEDEFIAIKKIRDLAAHGQPVKTQDDWDISFEFQIRDKLWVFLMYLVHKDFGFSSSDYATSLRGTFCKYVRNAETNDFERDKLVGKIPLFEVDKNNFEEALNYIKSHVGVEYFKSEGRYQFSSEITTEIHDKWMTDSDKFHPNMVDYIKDFLANTDVVSVKYINQVYLICGEHKLDLHGVCLVTY